MIRAFTKSLKYKIDLKPSSQSITGYFQKCICINGLYGIIDKYRGHFSIIVADHLTKLRRRTAYGTVMVAQTDHRGFRQPLESLRKCHQTK